MYCLFGFKVVLQLCNMGKEQTIMKKIVAFVCLSLFVSTWLIGAQLVSPEMLSVHVDGDASATCSNRTVERTYTVAWDFEANGDLPSYGVQGWNIGLVIENTGGATSYIKNAVIHPDSNALSLYTNDLKEVKYYEPSDMENAVVPPQGFDPEAGLEGVYGGIQQGIILRMSPQVVIPVSEAEPVFGFGAIQVTVVLQGNGAGSSSLVFTTREETTPNVGSPGARTITTVDSSSQLPSGMEGVTVEIIDGDDPACDFPLDLLTVSVDGDTAPTCIRRDVERTFVVSWDFDADEVMPLYGVQGWNIGVALENTGDATSYIKNAVIHPDANALNLYTSRLEYYAGNDLLNAVAQSPDFDPAAGMEGRYAGVQQGLIFGLQPEPEVIEVADGAEVLGFGAMEITVVLQGDGAGTSSLVFTTRSGDTPTIGDPGAKTVAVIDASSKQPPAMDGVSIDILDDETCDTVFYLSSDDPADHIMTPRFDIGVAETTRTIMLQETPANGIPSGIQGFSFALTKPAGLEVDVTTAEGTMTAEWVQVEESADCMAIAVLFETESPYNPSNVLIALDPTPIFDLDLATIPDQWIGVEDPAELSFDLDHCADIEQVIVVNGESYPIENEDFALLQRIEPIVKTRFIRGDANVDGKVDLADVVFMISNRLASNNTAAFLCLDAADVNNDETIDISDMISLLFYLFNVEFDGSVPPQPAAPYPVCGFDEEGTVESCASYPPCAG